MSSEYQLTLKAVLDTSQINQELNKIQRSTNGGLKFDMKELDQLQSKLEKLRSYVQQFKLNINVDDIDNALKKIKTIRVKPIIDQTELQKDLNVKASTTVNVSGGGGRPVIVNNADNTVLKNVNSSLTKLNSNFTKANSNVQRNVSGGTPYLPTKNIKGIIPLEDVPHIKNISEFFDALRARKFSDKDISRLVFWDRENQEKGKLFNPLVENIFNRYGVYGQDAKDLRASLNNARIFLEKSGVYDINYDQREKFYSNYINAYANRVKQQIKTKKENQNIQKENQKIQELNTQQIAGFAAQYFANNLANLEEPLKNLGFENFGTGVGIAGRSAAQGLGAFGALAGIGFGGPVTFTGGAVVAAVTGLIEFANATQEAKKRLEEMTKSINDNAAKTQERSTDTYNKAYTSTFDSLASRLSIEALERLKKDADKEFDVARGYYESYRDSYQGRKLAIEDEFAGYIEKNPSGKLGYIAQRDKLINRLNDEGDDYQKAFNDAKARQDMITAAYNERKTVIDNYTKVLKELTSTTSTEILTEKELDKTKKKIVDLLSKGIATGKERKEIDQLVSDYNKNKTAFDLEQKTKKQYDTLAQNELDTIDKNEKLKIFGYSLENRDKESIKGEAEQIDKERVALTNRIKELSEKALNKNLTSKEKKSILDEIDKENDKLSHNKNKLSSVETWFGKYKTTEVSKLQDQLSKLKTVDTSHATSLGQYGYGMGTKDDGKQILKAQENLMKQQKEIQDEIKNILEEKLPVDSTFS